MTTPDKLDAIILRPGEGRKIPGPEGLTVKATAQATNGSIGFLEATSSPGFGAPRHVHHTCEEIFYVLDGEFDILVGERRIKGSSGTFVLVPRGTVHAPKVVGPNPGKVLIAFAPGGQESAFDDFADLAESMGEHPDSTDERMQAVAAKYGSQIVGPPL